MAEELGICRFPFYCCIDGYNIRGVGATDKYLSLPDIRKLTGSQAYAPGTIRSSIKLINGRNAMVIGLDHAVQFLRKHGTTMTATDWNAHMQASFGTAPIFQIDSGIATAPAASSLPNPPQIPSMPASEPQPEVGEPPRKRRRIADDSTLAPFCGSCGSQRLQGTIYCIMCGTAFKSLRSLTDE